MFMPSANFGRVWLMLTRLHSQVATVGRVPGTWSVAPDHSWEFGVGPACDVTDTLAELASMLPETHGS